MSSVSAQIYRFCYSCEAVASLKEESLVDINKQVVKTVKKLMNCTRCHIASYCSKECQKSHWKSHKVHCIENHTAFYDMSRARLLFTMKTLFQKTSVSSMPDQIHMGYGTMILLLDGILQFKEINGRYAVQDDKIFESFRQLIPNDISIFEQSSDLALKTKSSYLKQLKYITENFKDRYVIDVSIRPYECVGNFQFKICFPKDKESKSK